MEAGRQSPAPGPGRPPTWRSLLRAVNFDVLFLGLFLVIFVYMYWDALDFRFTSGYMPRIIAGVGIVLIGIHFVQQMVRKARDIRTRGRILDISYEAYSEGVTERTVWMRTAEFFASMVALFFMAWLLGFHVGIPLFVFLYMRIWGRASWFNSLWPAIGLWAAITIVYGILANSIWPTSPLEALLGVNFQDIFERPFAFLR